MFILKTKSTKFYKGWIHCNTFYLYGGYYFFYYLLKTKVGSKLLMHKRDLKNNQFENILKFLIENCNLFNSNL